MRWALLALLTVGCGGAARHIPPPNLPQAHAPLERSPPAKSLQHYALAVLSWQRGELPQAQEHIGIALLFDPDAAWLHLARGRLAIEQGELDSAKTALTRAIHLDRADPQARLLLARVLEIEGDYAGAARQLQALLELHRSDQAFADLAQLHLVLDQPELAAAAVELWLEAPPVQPSWLARRASLLLELDRPSLAWKDLAQLLEAGGAGGPAVDLLMQATHRCRRYGSTLALLERVVLWEPGNEDMVVRLGGLAEQAGVHDQAAMAWTRLDLLRGGADPRVKLMQAQALLAAGQPSLALEAIQAAVDLDSGLPDQTELRARALFACGQLQASLDLIESQEGWQADANLLLLQADLLEAAERYTEARDSLRAALDVAPPSWILAHGLATLEARTGGLEAALALVEMFPDPMSGEPERQLIRARLLREAGQRDEALALSKVAEQSWPEAASLAHTRTAWLREDGESSAALACARRAVERMPTEPSLARQLALLELEAGSPMQARTVLREALTRHPDHPHLLNDLAYLEVEAGEHGDEVLAMARRAVDQNPASGAFQDTLGWLLLARGERTEARTVLERAAQLAPEDPVVAAHLAQALEGAAAPIHETR